MLIQTLSTGDKVHRYNKSVVVQFCGKRGVLSTGILNGGYNEKLNAVFNHDAKAGAGMGCKLKADTYLEHMEIVTRELGLEPKSTSCIGTAADMENLSIKSEIYKGVTVTAMVTGGIETNGGRVGDPASFHEVDGEIEQLKPGTINMLIMIDAKLPARTLTRALVTATEAKTAAIQELMAGSNYSHGIATGSGTDGTIIMSNLESNKELTNAGKHAKLGELIGKAVKAAVKEALHLQTELSPEYQCSVFKRFKRFGLTEESVWNSYVEQFNNECLDKVIDECKDQVAASKTDKDKINKKNNKKDLKREETYYKRKINKLDYIHYVQGIEKNEELVGKTSLYIHLLDQLDWGLLSPETTFKIGKDLIKDIASFMDVSVKLQDPRNFTVESVMDTMIKNYEMLLVEKINNVN